MKQCLEQRLAGTLVRDPTFEGGDDVVGSQREIAHTATPSGSRSAFAMAAAVGPWAILPAPRLGSPGRSMTFTSVRGTAVNRRIG